MLTVKFSILHIHENSVLLCFELPAGVPRELLLPMHLTTLTPETSDHHSNKKMCYFLI